MHERMSSVIELRFDFNDRDPGDLEQINRLLATMELTDVDVKDIKGYLATTQEFQNDRVVQTTYRYGLDSGTLICKRADDAQTYRFQVATEAFEGANAMGDGQFAQYWRKLYPHRKLSTVITIGFERPTAFLVVYFEEPGKDRLHLVK